MQDSEPIHKACGFGDRSPPQSEKSLKKPRRKAKKGGFRHPS